MPHEFEIRDITPQPVASIRLHTTLANMGPTLDQLLPEIWQYVTGLGVTPIGPPFTRSHSFSITDIDLEAGIPVAAPITPGGRVQSSELPGGPVAITNHFGPYDTLSKTYEALEAWIKQQGRQPGDGPWEVYWTDPSQVPNSAEWRTEILWPLK